MSLDEIIERNDPDEVLREINRRCERRDWAGLQTLIGRCHLATERGKQLWGAAAHGEYRLALEAPAQFAAAVIEASPSPFALGPLAEVVASTHTWVELRPHLHHGPLRSVVAYERVARGEDLSSDDSLAELSSEFEIPLALQMWEPAYPEVVYSSSEVRALAPVAIAGATRSVATSSSVEVIDDDESTDALSGLVQPWVTESNGAHRSIAVDGGIDEAAMLLGVTTDFFEVSAANAVALMAWAGASGGAYGKRRGLSVGRRKAWLVLRALLDADEVFPADLARLRFWTWGNQDPDRLEISIAVSSSVEEITWAIHAVDQKD